MIPGTRPTPLALALALSFGTLAMAPAQAQTGAQRVEVTGSAIKRTDTETPAPVEVITREEIRRTGATTINELIKAIPVIDVLDTGELQSNSPGGSGSARVRLRGLGDTQTLVLINGRRVPNNPLDDATGAGAAFDVNQLPLSAIERVEILKDGGSAIYGSDAVAGVVNFILRRNYNGVDGKITLGQSSRSDAREQQYGVSAGLGDLDRDRFNVLASVDVFKRDPLLRSARENSNSVDFRRFGPIPGFNLDGRSSFAPEGNFLDPTGSFFDGRQVKPCPPQNLSGTRCRYDFNASLLTAYNGADRVSGLLSAQVLLGKDTTAYARLMGSQNKDHFEAHPVPDFFLHSSGDFYAGRFMQGGPRITDRKSDFLNIDLGAEGVIGNLDWTVGLSRGKAETVNRDKNYYNRTLWDQATGSGALDATSGDNPTALVDSLKVSPVRSGSATLDLADGRVSGDLFKLGGGSVRYAVGAAVWKETLVDKPDDLSVQGLVVGSIQQSAVDRSRDAKAVFAELQLPIARNLEAQLAARHDKYDSASATSPKVGIKWQPMPALALRGSYSEAFKMPTLKQLHANAGEGAINLTEAQCTGIGLPAGCNGTPAFRVTGSNPDLKPENGKSWNLGVVGDVGPLSLSVDFWRIDKTDNIATPTLDQAIEDGFWGRDAAGRVRVFQNLQNFAESRNSGIDVDGRLTFRNTALGKLTVRGMVTYYTSQATRSGSGDPWAEFNATYATPRWRSSLSLTSESGPWTLQALVRGTSGFYDTSSPQSDFGDLPAGGLRRVGAYDEVDFTASYTGIRNLTLSLAVKNLFDRMPPFSATNATDNNNSQMGFAELYTNRGRYFQVSAQYQFK